jgi:hypothetical protein
MRWKNGEPMDQRREFAQQEDGEIAFGVDLGKPARLSDAPTGPNVFLSLPRLKPGLSFLGPSGRQRAP